MLAVEKNMGKKSARPIYVEMSYMLRIWILFHFNLYNKVQKKHVKVMSIYEFTVVHQYVTDS